MAKARARHILVQTEDEANNLINDINSGSDFAELASQYSLCPSKSQGGDLGEFFKGQMVPEFDEIVFSEVIGSVHGPVKTQFGYHLIEIISRDE